MILLGLFLIFVHTEIWVEQIDFPLAKYLFGQQIAELTIDPPLFLLLRMVPATVFRVAAGAPFKVLGREEISPTTDVLVLRPTEWILKPRLRRRGDPYERFWVRGPWGVEIENPTIIGETLWLFGSVQIEKPVFDGKGKRVLKKKKFLQVVEAGEQDLVGDLRIEVPKNVGESELDNLGRYIRELKVRDRVLLSGPARRCEENDI
ncbi:hypothetical protein BDZ45DRAFT_671708 [Acephala macrosclerotiorum]|nr:hypothetical protein BDZ45DRAFT_671708 [Acephala macrosclerotiorum]